MSTISTQRKSHLVARASALVIALFAVFATLSAAGPASAYVGETKTVPSYNSTSGKATLTGFHSGYSSGSYSVKVNYTQNTGACMYIQAKPVARWATDGDWKRKTNNTCSTGTRTLSFSDTFYLGYDGVKVRFCKDLSWQSDSCGGDVTIYR